MKQLKNRLKTWGERLVAPTDLEGELAWRGYVLNTLLVALIFFTIPYFFMNLTYWMLGLDVGSTIAAFFVLFVFFGIYWVSRNKSVTVAIYLFSALSISLSFFLSIGWGVADIATTSFYVMAIIENSILLRGRYALIVLGSLVAGYLGLGLAELNGWFTPPFFTDIGANHISVSFILLFLTFLGHITSRLIDQALAAQVTEAARRQELESRAKIAAEVQLKMLPSQAPVRPEFDIAGQSIPAREVGGDFYNYHQRANGEIAIVIGDVTGKGMPAALLMAVITGMIDSVIPSVSEPAELLTIIASRLRKHTRENGLNAACLAAFFTNNEFCVANAGCIAPVIRRSTGQLEWLDVGGLPMGVEDTAIKYKQVETQLNAGDWIIFTTDGVVEAQNTPGKIMGFEALETIISTSPTHSAQAMRGHIINQVERYQGPEDLHDDMTVIVVQVKGHSINAA